MSSIRATGGTLDKAGINRGGTEQAVSRVTPARRQQFIHARCRHAVHGVQQLTEVVAQNSQEILKYR